MSIAGKFNVNGTTPSGNLEITLELLQNADSYSGTMEARGSLSPLNNITVEGNSFTARGIMRSPYGEIDLLIKGTVEGSLFTGELVSEYMSVEITGNKIY